MGTSSKDPRRALRSFWGLTFICVAAAGSFSAALAAPAGPLTGARVAFSGLVLLVALVLAARVLVALDRARREKTGDRRA